jgi:2-oxoisovalerate dehydrogenase E1 component
MNTPTVSVQHGDVLLSDIPGFQRDLFGKPKIGLDDSSVYAYGNLIRGTEELILDLFSRGLLSGTTHTCLGQELCQMAVVRALNDPDDVVLSNHRNHGHFMTYSGHFTGLVAEIMGREAGVCGGYGGSQHMTFRHFHSNGVQAGMTAIGTGLALARKMGKRRGLVATMIGDGTLGEGLLYESMNLASTWKAPVLFVVENNGIAQTTYTNSTIGGSIIARGEAFGLATFRLDDSVGDFCKAVGVIVEEMRDAGRPGMLVIDTRRLGPHSKGDDLRSEAERNTIIERDPLKAIGKRLSTAEREVIEARNATFLREVEAAALASPEARFAAVPQHAFRKPRAFQANAQPAKAVNVRGAINAALRDLLSIDDNVIILGEDLHEPYGGAFKVTAGLSAEFPERVISTPISEAGITGSGIGLALAGKRPIVEIMFADFLSLCMDQIYNHATKFPGMFPEIEVPLVVRTPCGGRRGYGATHSQSPENIFVSVPGLTVIYGSHRHNVGQLLVDTVRRWPNPTVFLEHKLLYGEAQDPAGYEIIAPSAADPGAELFPTLRGGSHSPDVTLVSFGGMLPIVERAAKRLTEEEELEVEIVALSLLAPLPRQTLIPALFSRSHVAVIEESHHEFGVSAEILASLAEAGYCGKVIRIGMPPTPIASARSLERDQLPDEHTIVSRVLNML